MRPDSSLDVIPAGNFVASRQTSSEQSNVRATSTETSWRDFVNLGGLLCSIVGLSGLWLCPHEGPVHAIAEGLFIAGVLTIVVDPFLKRRLIKDAARDIFHHLLGLDLPVEIRDSLRDFVFKTDTYRSDMTIAVHVRKVADGVEVDIKADAKVIATRSVKYIPGFACENAENVSFTYFSATSEVQPKLSYSQTDISLRDKDDEPGVLEWHGKAINLRKGESVRTHFSYTVKRSATDFYVLYFGAPTINPIVRISCDKSVEATANKPDQQNGGEYWYRKVFLAGDHINIRWRTL